MDSGAGESSSRPTGGASNLESMAQSFASIASTAESTRNGTDNNNNNAGNTTPRRPRPTNRRTEGNSLGSQFLSPGIRETENQRRPLIGRRISTKGRPHRGQEFSVDDGSQEMEAHMALQRQQSRMASGSNSGTSTIRRRPAAPVHRLPPLDSEDQEPPSRREPKSNNEALMSPEQLYNSYSWERSAPRSEEGGDINNNDNNNKNGVGNDDNSPGSPIHRLSEREELENIEGSDEEEENSSDAESFTLKDRQDAINETHPFGIRIWKPALYKKHRSVEKGAEGDIHSTPGGHVSGWLFVCNFFWTLLFGWWMAALAFLGAVFCLIFAWTPGSGKYGTALLHYSRYIFYPFGKYVKIVQEEAYAEEDEGEGRSIGEYEQWQSGDLEDGHLFFGPVRSLIGRRRGDVDSEDEETTSLLGRRPRREADAISTSVRPKRRLFGRGKWTVGRVLYFFIFYFFITPSLLLVSGICWLMVFTIPMGRVTYLLFDQMRRRPLSLEFHSERGFTRRPDSPPSAILVCTYRAVGFKYWKYTVDGTNIILINLLAVVAFAIFDYWVLRVTLGLQIFLTNTVFLFCLSIFSIMPLAYFIGQAVASISAQSTMGVGAAINAFFSTIVEVFLYCVALNDGKAQLVEGSVVGSIFAGILLLPGISMCFGAIKRKTQRFNVRSAGVTSTMLLFASIGAFSPTLFYQIYGAHELSCHQCNDPAFDSPDRDCRRCFFTQVPAINDPFYKQAVLPYVWFSAILLFLSYVIGTMFTLRTHAATIWNVEIEEKKQEKHDHPGHRSATPPHGHGNLSKSAIIDYGGTVMSRQSTQETISGAQQDLSRSEIKSSKLYKQILGHSLKQAGIQSSPPPEPLERTRGRLQDNSDDTLYPEAVIGSEGSHDTAHTIQGLSEEQNRHLTRQMAEMVATATTVAQRDVHHSQHRGSFTSLHHSNRQASARAAATRDAEEVAAATGDVGGHDAPNWSRTKSYLVLFTATVAYAVIAEILVRTVDAVLEHSDIDEKFLGITIFALVPNTTEFLNAISFAMNGNIALSMEIGSAYALQVCLLQMPALVLFGAISHHFIDPSQISSHTFSLIFPQWDMVTTILCVFLLSYMYSEGKSNYFKGSILILSYLVVLVGFYFAGFNVVNGGDPNQSSIYPKGALTRYRTMSGRGTGTMMT